MKHKEIEFKYKADGIGLKKAKELFESLPYKKKLEVGSWDVYYTSGDKPFVRDRRGTGKDREVTSKEKTVCQNNNVRREVNVHSTSTIDDYNKFMEMIGADRHKIAAKYDAAAHISVKFDLDKMVNIAKEELGYVKNFKIYKMCWIYWTKDVNVVYYVVFNEDFQEVGRFMEIEANQDKEWESEEQAMNAVLDMEQKFAGLGISPQNRLKKSLFEMFRKED